MEYFGPGGWAFTLTAAVIGPGLFSRGKIIKRRRWRMKKRMDENGGVKYEIGFYATEQRNQALGP